MVEAIAEIAFREVMGLPIIVYGGAFTFICFLTTAAIGFLTIKGIKRFPLNWHTRMAYLSIAAGMFHGILGLLAFWP
jgi:hypothetical protein